MPQQATVPAVNQRVLAQGLEQLRTAADEDTVRINPVRFAEQHGVPTQVVVELFLHARKLGLVTMEWQYFCPGCGEIVERLASLTSATSHFFCQVCTTDAGADRALQRTRAAI